MRAPHFRQRRDSIFGSAFGSSSKATDSRTPSAINHSRQEKRNDESVRKSKDGPAGTSNDQKTEPEIQRLKLNRWKFVKTNLIRIVEYGRREGILSGEIGPLASQTGPNTNAGGIQNEENENVGKTDKREDEVVKITTRDLSLIHAAIPFLPVPVAAFCFFMNIVFPGTGTILSGFCGVCMGQPRINLKEGRRFMTFVVNFMVGVAQLGTITFLLVGWFWSMAWGGLLVAHSLIPYPQRSISWFHQFCLIATLLVSSALTADILRVQYREALMQHRQEAVATAAIEALTRDAILRRRDVRTLVQERKQEQGAAALEDSRRRSMFARLGNLGKRGNVKAPNGKAAA